MKRVGKRGEGKWKRISWDEALTEIADKLRTIREEGKQEEFAFHQGRQRSKDAIKRFLDAYGTKTQLSHRSLCSGNRRAANLTYLWESDWDLNDCENSKYILNFGSNAFEAHQGHVPFLNRIQNGRDLITVPRWLRSTCDCRIQQEIVTNGFRRFPVQMVP